MPAPPLTATFTLAFPYTRTTGPVVGRFLQGLRDGQLWGQRCADGRVIVPPTGYDPVSSEALDQWVELPGRGTLESFAVVTTPLTTHPRTVPFAWALIRLDGAATCILHVLDMRDMLDRDDPASLQCGRRVRAVWSEERHGTILDLHGFVLDEAAR